MQKTHLTTKNCFMFLIIENEMFLDHNFLVVL